MPREKPQKPISRFLETVACARTGLKRRLMFQASRLPIGILKAKISKLYLTTGNLRKSRSIILSLRRVTTQIKSKPRTKYTRSFRSAVFIGTTITAILLMSLIRTSIISTIDPFSYEMVNTFCGLIGRNLILDQYRTCPESNGCGLADK